ncbi:M56 family metallopeptidase [Hymenobacter nivis]|uniref:M56 family peptidase n=1 Tax=Hymenobacter nivis TaxID=1850093 RepID=A0A502GX30_9BACT|nr:M56 family metallopeptidase [Hymenobacter nivis]TPG65556.1 M56 family peptidase [Hymenobacter nivis]
MPSAPLLYLLKAHAVLLLFAAAYFGLLRPLTFFALNRAYLAFTLLFAAIYPALPVPALWPAAAPAPAVAWVLAELPAGAPAAALPAPGPDWPAWLLAAYAAGAALLLGRLLVQLLSLARLHRAARPALAPGGMAYRQLAGGGGPFSFGRTIYLSPAQHPAPAELAAVLAHEQAHVRQAHTLDVLLAHVATAVFWLNPAAWLLRRALLDNLEYLADAATLRTGLDRRAYQYSLLRLGPPAGSPALVSPFSFSTLKNRILMMNRPVSNRLQLLRYALAGPLVVAAALAFSGAQAEPVPLPAVAPVAPKLLPSDAVYYVDGQLVASDALSVVKPESISSINVLKGQQAEALTGKATGSGAILVTTKGHENSPEVLAFNEKVRRLAPRLMGINDQGEARAMRAGAPAAVVAVVPQSGPKPGLKPFKGAARSYYVDGQYADAVTADAVKDIASMQILKGEMAKQFLGYNGDSRIVIAVTTKAKMDSPEVVEFNKRIQQIAPQKGQIAFHATGGPQPIAPAQTAPPAGRAVSISYVAAPALAYITKNYPDSRITGVTELKNAKTGQLNYRVEVTQGRRPQYAVFDAQGQPVIE